MSKVDKALELLDGLVEQLHYFYGNNETKFRNHVLKDVSEIENILTDLATNKQETFKKIARKYSEFYKKKQEVLDNTIASVNESRINDSIREKYRQNTEEDRK